mgnify:CR=1 FL=1
MNLELHRRMKQLVVGCGYLGSRVARLWRDAGNEVHVVTRSAERAAALAPPRAQIPDETPMAA